MAKRKLTQNQAEYKKQVARIRRAANRLIKSGYRFDVNLSEIIPERPKRISKSYLKELQKITPPKLRKHTTALDLEHGQPISGTEAFKQARKAAAKRGAITRRHKNLLKPAAGTQITSILTGVPTVYTGEAVYIGDLVLGNVESLINEFPTAPGAQGLMNLLKSEINKYGETAVAQSLANAPYDMVKMAEEILFYPEKYGFGGGESNYKASRAYRDFAHIIRGNLPTRQDLIQDESIMETLI